VVDPRNIYPPEDMEAQGLVYEAVGRGWSAVRSDPIESVSRVEGNQCNIPNWGATASDLRLKVTPAFQVRWSQRDKLSALADLPSYS